MRVLLIDVNCKYSSTGKIVYDLYKNLRSDGHKAAIAYGRGERIKEPGIYKFGLDWETYLHAGLARITGYNGCFSFFSTKRLINFIEYFKPDVIHIHELHAYFVNIVPLINYIKMKHIKLVWTFHCEYMYTGKCGVSYECEKWKTECRKCPHLHDYPNSILFDHTKQMFGWKKKLLSDLDFVIVTPSQWLADRVKHSFLKDKTIKVIQNGIDTSLFKPVDSSRLRKELQIPKDYKIVLSVAPNIMSERKGGQWVLKIAEKMKEKKVIFVLVGGGTAKTEIEEHDLKDSALKVQKKSVCSDDFMYIKENVVLHKTISSSFRMSLFYSMADVFVLCSERETFSMVCAESICCGTRICGFKCGAPETVFEEPYAHFVGYGDLNNLIRSIFDIIYMGSKDISSCRNYGLRKFDSLKIYNQWAEIYGLQKEQKENEYWEYRK